MLIAECTPSLTLERSGRELGAELAAALVLASSRVGDDTGLKRRMAAIVLQEISAAADRLRGAAVPEKLIEAYELACRAGIRTELKRTVGESITERRAA